MKKIEFVFQEAPEIGKVHEITPGVFWFPMPLPMMGPEYVNCYILDDGNDIVLVDTGANFGDCKYLWESVLSKHFFGKKISNIYVTHHHPDHTTLTVLVQQLSQIRYLIYYFPIENLMTSLIHY